MSGLVTGGVDDVQKILVAGLVARLQPEVEKALAEHFAQLFKDTTKRACEQMVVNAMSRFDLRQQMLELRIDINGVQLGTPANYDPASPFRPQQPR